jgi:hypothetical protein
MDMFYTEFVKLKSNPSPDIIPSFPMNKLYDVIFGSPNKMFKVESKSIQMFPQADYFRQYKGDINTVFIDLRYQYPNKEYLSQIPE